MYWRVVQHITLSHLLSILMWSLDAAHEREPHNHLNRAELRPWPGGNALGTVPARSG